MMVPWWLFPALVLGALAGVLLLALCVAAGAADAAAEAQRAAPVAERG